MRRIPRPLAIGVGLVAVAVLGIALGVGPLPRPRLFGSVAGSVGGHGRHAGESQVALDVTPATNAKNLPITTEIGTKVSGGTVDAVTLTEQGGGQVGGAMRGDGSSWIPNKPLKFGRTYTAKVTARDSDGRTVTRSTSFSTMKEPDSRVATGLNMTDSDSRTFGVAMPVAVRFDEEVPASARAAVERRLFVTSDPPQPGAWRWFTGREVLYRPQNYWKPGTKINVRAALDGVPLGNDRYGDTDHTASGTIGRDFEMKVDNKTKSMSVYQDGKLLKTMPVSLGKPSTPSSSGTMVIMERDRETVFDTRRELGPVEGYRVNIQWAQRLTWGGQFIHSAPWSVWDQGRDNVSHGCVNLSPENAKWLFDRTEVGDPVTVQGTEAKLDPGDGWTAWNMSWANYLKGARR
ncbi:MAG: L,D-transpeptidase family protein [Micromonosporaceae bacterium]|nr:L,D-transpeptidase family protein [Micromonosporaceae bacterium]